MGKKVEKSGIGGRARTMAWAGPTNVLNGSRGLPAAYHYPGSLGPQEAFPNGPEVVIEDAIQESLVEAREERKHSERRMGTGTNMEDIVIFCEGSCRKHCHSRVPVEENGMRCSSGSNTRCYRKRGSPKPSREEAKHLESRMGTGTNIVIFCEGSCRKHCHSRVPVEEDGMSCNSGLNTRCYRKHGSPKPSKGDAETAMEMAPSPVRWMFSAPSHYEGYHTCYPSDSTSIEPNFPVGRWHTTANPKLAHDAEWESLPRRVATTRVPRHTEFGATVAAATGVAGDGEEGWRMDGNGSRRHSNAWRKRAWSSGRSATGNLGS